MFLWLCNESSTGIGFRGIESLLAHQQCEPTSGQAHSATSVRLERAWILSAVPLGCACMALFDAICLPCSGPRSPESSSQDKVNPVFILSLHALGRKRGQSGSNLVHPYQRAWLLPNKEAGSSLKETLGTCGEKNCK